MKKQIPLAAVIGVGVLILAIVGYMALIKPKQSDISSLDDEIAGLEHELEVKERERERALAAAEAGAPLEETQIEVADLVRLSKAMPEADDVAGLLVELDAIAASAGIEFVSIQPLTPVDVGSGYTQIPVNLTFTGSYFDLTEVLYQLRNLVRVRDGELTAAGRLFTLDQFDMHEAADGFPQIEALLTVSAYSFGSLDGALAPPLALGVAEPLPASEAPADEQGAPQQGADGDQTFEEVDPNEPPALPENPDEEAS